MLPKETATPEAEAYFGRKLMLFSVAWIVLTIVIGMLLVVFSSAFGGVTPWLPALV